MCNALSIIVGPFTFGHCVVCLSSIYGFWLTLWYLHLQTHIDLKHTLLWKCLTMKLYNATFNNISVISWWSVWTIEPRSTTKVHFMYWLNRMHYITCLVRQTVWCFTSSSGSQCCIDKMTAVISWLDIFDITEILLKVALYILTLTPPPFVDSVYQVYCKAYKLTHNITHKRESIWSNTG
jgi:hypothetical protein